MDKRAGILVDLKALKNNIKALKSNLPMHTKFAAVVKADAYGHGAIKIAKACCEYGADLLCFATANETIDILKQDINCPIMVLGPLFEDTLDLVIDFKVRHSVFLKEHILMLQEKAQQKDLEAFVHVKVDTGMNRTGVKNVQYFKQLLQTIIDCDRVVFEGLFTHFSSSDESDKTFSDDQMKQFEQFIDISKEYGFNPIIHACNSGGIIDLPNYAFDFVRGGISMYGCYPSDHVNHKNVKLQPMMSVYSHVVNINTLQKGDSVSYGRTFIANHEMRIATIAIGYGDGFNRLLSNLGHVLIQGKKAKIVGTVCMDMTMVDITDIDGVTIGDKVVIIGSDGQNSITADDHANLCGTISYEILLSFTDRLKREYINE